MKRKLIAILILALLPSVLAAASVTGAGGGVFPADTGFNGVPVSGLEFGYGVITGSPTVGQFSAFLLGVAVGDVQQRIRIFGEVSSGQQTAANAAVIAGTATIDM